MQVFLPVQLPSSQSSPPRKVSPPHKVCFLPSFSSFSLPGIGSRDGGDTPKKPPSLLGDPQALSVPLPPAQVGPSFLAGNLRLPFVFPPSQRGPSEVGFYFISFLLPRNPIVLSRFPGKRGCSEQSPRSIPGSRRGFCSCASERDRSGMSLRSASNAAWTGSLSSARGSEAPALSPQLPELRPSALPAPREPSGSAAALGRAKPSPPSSLPLLRAWVHSSRAEPGTWAPSPWAGCCRPMLGSAVVVPLQDLIPVPTFTSSAASLSWFSSSCPWQASPSSSHSPAASKYLVRVPASHPCSHQVTHPNPHHLSLSPSPWLRSQQVPCPSPMSLSHHRASRTPPMPFDMQ